MSAPHHEASEYHLRDTVPITRALISVSDKSGLSELAQALAAAGVQIVSTGSTAKAIAALGVPVTEVSEVTGFPESLDGRVKTLHPAIHTGILADLRLAEHERQLRELGIAPFDLVVVNLYPFVKTVASGAEAGDVVEQIDIGGPALVRASAKNFANVTIVVDPSDYPEVISSLGSGTRLEQRRALAAKAFGHTAGYDRAVADWFQTSLGPDAERWPAEMGLAGERAHVLRYGENPHQQAALYTTALGSGIAQAEQLHGKEMSYNNYVDADAAVRAAYDFDRPAVAIIKHSNPCGIAVATPGAEDGIADAHAKAHACDPLSAYGGVIAANRPVTVAMAQAVKGIFTEVIVAPAFEPAALELLSTKKNLRILRLPQGFSWPETEIRPISGGFLAQDADRFLGREQASWTLQAGDAVDEQTMSDLRFAWTACRAVKSNAILLAKDGASVGVGMGQVNRVDSSFLAVKRAGERAAGAVAASDAFFPFPDGLQVLIDAGVTAVAEPGGSIHDQDVIDAAKAAGISLYFTGERHFYH